MVGIAQLVEHGIVVPEAMGSSPITHPSFAPVAQLDRASDFESEGRRFESYRVYLCVFFLWVHSSIGRASDS